MPLLGVPLSIWGFVCLAISAVWLFVWPSKTAATGTRRFILRWFHTLVWLCLAAAAFLGSANTSSMAQAAQYAAWLALLTYLVFMGALATARRK